MTGIPVHSECADARGRYEFPKENDVRTVVSNSFANRHSCLNVLC